MLMMIFITSCFALESGHSVTEMWSSLFDSAKKDSEKKETEQESLKDKLRESSHEYQEAENTVNDALQASHEEEKTTLEDLKKNPKDALPIDLIDGLPIDPMPKNSIPKDAFLEDYNPH